MPRLIAGRRARAVVQAFDFPAYARVEQVLHECDWAGQDATENEDRPPFEPLDTGWLNAEMPFAAGPTPGQWIIGWSNLGLVVKSVPAVLAFRWSVT